MASIELSNVSVSIPVYSNRSRSLKNRLLSEARNRRIEVTSTHESNVNALRNINLNLNDGDRIGLVGKNGAGKSTLLRVMAGIFEPCFGSVLVDGHIAPLFNISLGMDPEATGYENILIRGLFLGLSRSVVKDKVPEIAEFTELGEFLDLPVRTYSAGMKLRLAFGISTAINPDILLIDEGIGAGDAAFLDKANARLDAFAKKASIIVLASHAPHLIRRLCGHAVLLDQGQIVAYGPVEDVLKEYSNKNV